MTVDMELDFGIGLGDVDPAAYSSRDLQVLHHQIALAKLKVNEARYFLRLLRLHLNDEAATLFHFNGYVTALRACLDIVVNQADDPKAAGAWAKAKEAELMKNPDVQRILDLRNKAVHKGMKPPRLVIVLVFKEHLNGDRTLERGVRLESVNGKEIPDALGTMERALESLQVAVAEGEARGFVKARRKAGHAAHVDFQRETATGQWVQANPTDMEMFGRRWPQIGFTQGLRRSP